ncbi:MAG TPA: response regulator [Blastocatellia bacterium]|jgi:two-component system chemotaxis response regulator CheY|nr:response regulator [Blastocatellia bacterium]
MNGRSLLVVDDSATFRQLLCMSLQRVDGISRSDITEASDGEEALEKVKSNSFDLVLTDIRMPKMDGLEFVRQVRSELKRPDLPIIIISTKGADEDIELGMSLGASGYLSKPISMSRLKELVTNFLPEK